MGRSLVYQDFLAIKVLTSSLMFIYSKFENISLYLNNFLILFVTEPADSYILITLPCILSNKSNAAYVCRTPACRPLATFASATQLRPADTGECKDNLAHYLAGLIEGDGSFNVHRSRDKIIKDSTGKKRVAGIEVIGNIKDKPAFEFLQNKFGGNIYLTKGNSVRWNIKDLNSVVNVVNSINGKLRTPKILRLHKMIDFLNLYYGTNISKLPLDNSSLSVNAWLAGFIDSDGSFAIKGFTGNPRTYIAIQFYLAQRKFDLSGISMEEIMQRISNFLDCKLSSRIFKLNKKELDLFTITTSNKNSNQILIDYLNHFSLLSSKYLDFRCWERANYLYFNKLHKNPAHYEEIKLLKSSMNSKRTKFNWDHLCGSKNNIKI